LNNAYLRLAFKRFYVKSGTVFYFTKDEKHAIIGSGIEKRRVKPPFLLFFNQIKQKYGIIF